MAGKSYLDIEEIEGSFRRLCLKNDSSNLETYRQAAE